MRTLESVGHDFYIGPMQKKLAYRGSSNSETVCFKLERYAGKADLSECNCTIKTKNSEGKSDLSVPEVAADDDKLYLCWTPSSGATAVAGLLQVQLQFEKIFDDSSKNVNWQSNIMEFEIPDSLDAADEIADEEPTLFQQWEEKVNALYSDAAADVQAVQTLLSQVQADAEMVAQQKQNAEQTAAQAAQDAQVSVESSQDAETSAISAQSSASQAQVSAADANTSQSLSKGYSDAAKTYSDAAAVSEQNAQQQAQAAQQAAVQVQQKVNAFSGYTKEEIDNGFANALTGEASGQIVTLNDIQPNTNFRSLQVTGLSAQTATAQGKNLFDKNTLINTTAGNSVGSHFADSITARLDRAMIRYPIFVSAGNYTFVWDTGTLDVSFNTYDASGILVASSPWKTSSPSIFAVGDGIRYLSVTFRRKDSGNIALPDDFSASTAQLESGSAVTDYEPFIPDSPSPDYPASISSTTAITVSDSGNNAQTINLPHSLYSLPDGTADIFDLVSGAGTQRVRKAILSGIENWAASGILTNDYVGFYADNPDGAKGGSGLCDRFADGTRGDWEAPLLKEFLVPSNDKDGRMDIRILKARLSGWSDSWTSDQKVSAFKVWLAANPVTVYYALAESTALSGTPMKIPASFQNVTISADLGSVRVQYSRDLTAAIAKIERAVSQ